MVRNSLPGIYEGFAEKQYEKLVKRSLYISGFDGTKLALDVILPAGEDGVAAAGPFPAIMFISRGGRFTEAKKTNGVDILEHCIPYGYAGVILELRGCGASYGTNDSFASIEDRKDVNAAIDWIISQNWSDGQVATFGGSNRGLIQFAAAVTKPAPSKGLKGITPVVANPDFYYQDYPNGVSAIPVRMGKRLSGSGEQNKKKSRQEFLEQVVPVDADPDGAMAYEAYEKDQYGKNRNFVKSLLLENMCRDDGNPNFDGEKTNITIPPITDIDVFHDTSIKIHQFAGLLESGTFGQLMAAKEWGGSILVGPWDHHQSRTGNPSLPDGDFDFLAEHHKWFDSLMKGVDNGFSDRPPFIYYMLHGDEGLRWRASDTWPLENIKPVTFYLTGEASGSCSSVNDGSLSLVRPASETAVDYQVDTTIQVFDEGQGGTLDRMHMAWEGNMAPSVDEKGLTFTSAPLFSRYCNEIVGNTAVELWVTCSQPDADFILYLEEVLASGESRYISMGTMRASHRTEEPRQSWNACGATYHPCMREDMERCLAEGMEEPVCLRFAIEPAMYTFASGSRIRITVTCANKGAFQHPMYREEELPVIRLYQGGGRASCVHIPFVEHVENVYNGTVSFGTYEGPGTLYFYEKRLYLYYNGTWKNYMADSREASYEMRDGIACFGAGFTFRMEGAPVRDGAIQDYKGGSPVLTPLPYRRRCFVDTVPIAPHPAKLFVPAVKTLCVEEFVMDSCPDQPYPAILYMHGYGESPSKLGIQQRELLKNGYAIIAIDMRNYPPNAFPDYIYDVKGCIRYVRANAETFKINPDKLGASGQSLGGNAMLAAGVSAGETELEGAVGGNAGVSSRLQAIDIGFGWSELLYMGPDIMDEYREAAPEIQNVKFQNTDGPTAPAAEAIGFTGCGKGLKVLRDYMEAGREGEDSQLDAMVKKAREASPVNHIKPDCPPAALYGGLGMTRVDIPYRQSERTFEAYNRYCGDCFLLGNTNGEYGTQYPVVQGVVAFFDRYLKQNPPYRKCLAVPGKKNFVVDSCDKKAAYAPVLRSGGELYVAEIFLKEYFEVTEPLTGEMMGGLNYIPVSGLEQAEVTFRYFEDKDMALMVPAEVMKNNVPKKRN